MCDAKCFEICSYFKSCAVYSSLRWQNLPFLTVLFTIHKMIAIQCKKLVISSLMIYDQLLIVKSRTFDNGTSFRQSLSDKDNVKVCLNSIIYVVVFDGFFFHRIVYIS